MVCCHLEKFLCYLSTSLSTSWSTVFHGTGVCIVFGAACQLKACQPMSFCEHPD